MSEEKYVHCDYRDNHSHDIQRNVNVFAHFMMLHIGLYARSETE